MTTYFSTPPAAPDRTDPATFAARATASLNHWITMTSEGNTFATDMNSRMNITVAASNSAQAANLSAKGSRDETAVSAQNCEAQASSAAQAASQAQASATQAAGFVDLNNTWMAANALGLVIAPRQQEANLTVTAGNQGISYGPAILANNVRVVVESGAIWRIL